MPRSEAQISPFLLGFSLAVRAGLPSLSYPAEQASRFHLGRCSHVLLTVEERTCFSSRSPGRFERNLCVVLMNDSLTPASLSAVQSRIDYIADQAGVEGAARLSLEDTLAALPWPFRRRLVLALQSLKAFSPDPGVRDAAEFFQLKAATVWAAMPFKSHPGEEASDTTVLIESGGRRCATGRGKKV